MNGTTHLLSVYDTYISPNSAVRKVLKKLFKNIMTNIAKAFRERY